MAKKKKTAAPVKMSPEKYVRERARRFPIVGCKINRNWEETGDCSIIVVRERPDRNLIIGMYLVDMYCLGVKDAYVIPNGSQDDLDDIEKDVPEGGEMVDIDYNKAHNLIYGAIEFAEEGGIEPHPDFGLAEYVLEEDNEDIELIEFEYGYKGKHLLVIGPEGRERKYLNVLEKHLGANFNYIDPQKEDMESFFDDEDGESPYGGGWSEMPYTYTHPEFPEKLSVKNRWIAEALYSNKNYYALPEDVIARIMALPREEAVTDLRAIALYEMGRGYGEYNDTGELEAGNAQSSLLHTLVLLSSLGGEEAENTVFEMMRMPYDMNDYYFSDVISEFGGAMLYSVTGGNLKKIMEFLYEKGLSRDIQDIALYTLGAAAILTPERREEVIGMLRGLLQDMTTKIAAGDTFTADTAALATAVVTDLHAVELLPEIKDLYDMDGVNPDMCGDYKEAEEEIRSIDPEITGGGYNYQPFDEVAFYKWNTHWFGESEDDIQNDDSVNPLAEVEFAD